MTEGEQHRADQHDAIVRAIKMTVITPPWISTEDKTDD